MNLFGTTRKGKQVVEVQRKVRAKGTGTRIPSPAMMFHCFPRFLLLLLLLDTPFSTSLAPLEFYFWQQTEHKPHNESPRKIAIGDRMPCIMFRGPSCGAATRYRVDLPLGLDSIFHRMVVAAASR